jgi:putative sterol carrier protein
MTTLADITRHMQQAVGHDSGLGNTLKFDLGSAGLVCIDGGTVSNEDRPAALTITISMEDLVLLKQGQLTSMAAVMSGRMKVSDIGLAMSLQGKLAALFKR